MSETRKIAAILVADVVGYSRLAAADEDRTLSRLRGLRSDLIDPAIAVQNGRVVKRTGDGIIIEFRSVVDAVRCAIEAQSGLIERNAGVPELKQLLEFLHAEPGLPDNGPKRAWFEIAAGADRDCDGSRRIVGERHQVMTADDPIDHESGAPEGSNDALAVQRRQLAVGHARPRLLL